MRLGRKKRAAVLGCGPAGLFATHALIEKDWDVRIFSKKRKSHLYGAQYLHMPIPGLTPPDVESIHIKYGLTGTAEGYGRKVYGSVPVRTSVEMMTAEHMAWDVRSTYDTAWAAYSDLVTDVEINSQTMGITNWTDLPEQSPVLIDFSTFDVVLSSIPLPRICYMPEAHQFHSVKVWALGDAPDRGQYVPYRAPENTVECNGSPDVGWYRAANVFGHATVEWPAARKPPIPGVAEVTKPLYTDCVCYRKGDVRFKFRPIGRYGMWAKGVLTHHAYTQAANL